MATIPLLVFSTVHQTFASSGLHTKIHLCKAKARVSQMEAVWKTWGAQSSISSKEKPNQTEPTTPQFPRL